MLVFALSPMHFKGLGIYAQMLRVKCLYHMRLFISFWLLDHIFALLLFSAVSFYCLKSSLLNVLVALFDSFKIQPAVTCRPSIWGQQILFEFFLVGFPHDWLGFIRQTWGKTLLHRLLRVWVCLFQLKVMSFWHDALFSSQFSDLPWPHVASSNPSKSNPNCGKL